MGLSTGVSLLSPRLTRGTLVLRLDFWWRRWRWRRKGFGFGLPAILTLFTHAFELEEPGFGIGGGVLSGSKTVVGVTASAVVHSYLVVPHAAGFWPRGNGLEANCAIGAEEDQGYD